MIKEKSKPLNIESEQARIEERKERTPKLLYTGSLHEFGREDGRVIYQILKKVV